MGNELYHHGVKGQKWGVRRYQNRDGSLTRLGKKRLEEGAKVYPKYKGKILPLNSELSANRRSVFNNTIKDVNDDIMQKYEKYRKENPDFDKNPFIYGNEKVNKIKKWDTRFRDKVERENTQKKFEEKFLREYGDATLNDLGISITPETQKYVQKLLKNRNLQVIVTGYKERLPSNSFASIKQINKFYGKQFKDANQKGMSEDVVNAIAREWDTALRLLES